MKKISTFISLFFLLLLTYQDIFAQKGVISGKITDANTGELLIGATVVLDGTSTGTASDIDGTYRLENLQEGIYMIKVSFVSYTNKTVSEVAVKAGQVTQLDIQLNSSDVQLGEVIVTAQMERNTENNLQLLQKKSAVVQDGISNQLISRLGDNDVGAAAKRITGVSVEGGKYVYVRGLGDRYTKISLNSAEIPGLDPSRNTIQLDLFPSSLMDNIQVIKTFSAELPGDFTGGFVNLSTKEFPDNFLLQASAGWGFNTNASFNTHFLADKGGKLDLLGMDDGTRQLPALAEGDIPRTALAGNNAIQAQQLDQITKSFNKNLSPIEITPFLNQNYSFTVGNRAKIAGRTLGWVLGINYQNQAEYYDNGTTGRYTLSTTEASGLNNILLASDRRGTQDLLLGAILNLAYKLNDNHKLSLNIMRNQSGSSTVRFQEGLLPADFSNDGSQIFQTRTLQYLQRSINFFQLKGEHAWPDISQFKIDWHSAYTLSGQDEPDLRFFANDINYTAAGDTLYAVTPSVYRVPSRFYRQFDENTFDNKVNFSIGFRQWQGLAGRLKAGASLLLKDRQFTERRINYEPNNASYNGDPNAYFSDQNMGILGQNQFGYLFGLTAQDYSELRNNYNATQNVVAGYLSTDLPLSRKLKANMGVRMEMTNIEVLSKDDMLDAGKVKQTDFLPALNLIFEIVDNMNLRGSYSRTIARPTFRELAPFFSFDFIGDFVLVGNPNLKRTLINNFDLRWEYFFRPGEMVALSGFYKQFTNPIETAIEPTAQNTELSYRNVPNATIVGAEIELRKKLDFLDLLKNFSLGLNLSLIQSKVDINANELSLIRATDPTAPSTRQMFAQSPYLLNALLNYSTPKGLDININFNVAGKRLVVVSAGATPDVFEQPRPMLNAAISQKVGEKERWKLTLRANNLLNSAYNATNLFGNNSFAYQKYQTGRDIGVSVQYSIK